MLDISANEVWFVTGSQHLYGPATLGIVADHAASIAAGLGAVQMLAAGHEPDLGGREPDDVATRAGGWGRGHWPYTFV